MEIKKVKRGQISVEYLIVVGFIVFIVVILAGAAALYSSSIRDRIKMNQLSNFANKVISNSEAVFFAGEPSKQTITAYLPVGVTDIRIVDNQDLVITIQTDSGASKMAFTSDVPINGTLSITEGTKRIEIIAEATQVTINEV